MLRKILVATIALSLASATQASAQYSAVSSRSAIGGSGLINWGNVGAAGSYVSNPFNIGVTGTTLSSTVSQSGAGQFLRLDQGPTPDWEGNFAPGERLLFTNGINGPIDILFSNGVSAAGANLQTVIYGANPAFTARIEAFDAFGSLLSGFDFAGNTNQAGDGSAVFAGITSATGNIRRIRFSTVYVPGFSNFFTINQVSVNEQVPNPIIATPEPGTYMLMAAGLLCIVVMSRVRNRRGATVSEQAS